jgi:hypothetical protein
VSNPIQIPSLPLTGAQLRAVLLALDEKIGAGLDVPELPISGAQIREALVAMAAALQEAGGVLLGTAAPSTTIGADRDVYLRTSGEGLRIYGPKTNGNWGTGFLVGAGGGGSGSGGPDLSTADPQPLGTAAAGESGEASDAAHVHPMPTAADVGAIPLGQAPTFNWCAPDNALNAQESDRIYIVYNNPAAEFYGDWYYKSVVDGSFQPQQLPSAVQPENTYPTLGDFPLEGVQGLNYLAEDSGTNYYAAFVGGVFSSYEIVPTQEEGQDYYYSSLDALNNRDPVELDSQFYFVLGGGGQGFVPYAAVFGQWIPATVDQLIFSNGSGVLEGLYDDGINGGGVSLRCGAGFYLSWQGGVVRIYSGNDINERLPMLMEAPPDGPPIITTDGREVITKKVLEDVKWIWLTDEDYAPQAIPVDGVLTGPLKAIPAPVLSSTDFYPAPIGSEASVTEGLQIGDRIALIWPISVFSVNFGAVFTITALGEDDVSPWVLTAAEDAPPYSTGWTVGLAGSVMQVESSPEKEGNGFLDQASPLAVVSAWVDIKPSGLANIAAQYSTIGGAFNRVGSESVAYGRGITATSHTATYGFNLTNNLPGVAMLGSNSTVGDGNGGGLVLHGVGKYTESRVADPLDQGRTLYFDSEDPVEYAYDVNPLWMKGSTTTLVQANNGPITVIDDSELDLLMGPIAARSTANFGDQLQIKSDGDSFWVFLISAPVGPSPD